MNSPNTVVEAELNIELFALPQLEQIPVGLPNPDGSINWISWGEADDALQVFPEQALIVGEPIDRDLFNQTMTDAVHTHWTRGDSEAAPNAAKVGIARLAGGVAMPETLAPIGNTIAVATAVLGHLGTEASRTDVLDHGFYYDTGIPWHVEDARFATFSAPMDASNTTKICADLNTTARYASDPMLLGEEVVDFPEHSRSTVHIAPDHQTNLPNDHMAILGRRTLHAVDPITEYRPQIRML